MDAWCAARGRSRGAVLSLDMLWQLAQAWYHNRLSREYRGRTTVEVQQIFARLGLTSPFWQSSGDPAAPQK